MSARTFCAAAGLLLISGCATQMSEQACLATDWHTVGFEDGVAGRSEASIGRYRQSCADYGVTPNLAEYRAGHAEGVEIYCKPGQGFDVGRSGAIYQGVCPAGLEADFLANYDAGHHLYELESAVRSADAELASNQRAHQQIERELTELGIRIASADTPTDERVRLIARVAELGARHGQLGSRDDTLRDQRASAQAELDDYRQTLAFAN
jgi:Protein of unknown function (DUF2799)